jgi:hypothetical protein
MPRDKPLVARPVTSRPTAVRRGVLCALLLLSCCLLGASAPALGQEDPGAEEHAAKPDPWEPFRLLEGTWEGTIEGRLGEGRGQRRYDFILDGLYLVSRHASVRLPQEKSPKGDYHRELAVYSFDREREAIVLREFIVEGFVLQYLCEVEPKRFVCTSESVESGSGMRARLTVEVSDRYRFHETFELASPGQELEVFFTNSWTRVPNLAD